MDHTKLVVHIELCPPISRFRSNIFVALKLSKRPPFDSARNIRHICLGTSLQGQSDTSPAHHHNGPTAVGHGSWRRMV